MSATPVPDASAGPSEHQGGGLVDACLDALLRGPGSALEDLPQHLLVQLLQRSAREKQAAEVRAKAAEAELEQLKKVERYVVDPPLVQDRVGSDMSSRVDDIRAKWRPCGPELGGGHNIAYHHDWNVGGSREWKEQKELWYNTSISSFELLPVYDPERSRSMAHLPFVISSALLLYRLCCLFPVEVNTKSEVDRYKRVWRTDLCHIGSGRVVTFGEVKAAINVWVRQDAPSMFTPDFRPEMLLELLNLLCDPRCPHTYDGTVAGSVA